MTSNDEYVLQLLREKGYVSAEQLEAASQAMREENETTLDVLVASGTISEDDVLGTIADTFGIKYVSIDPAAIEPEVAKQMLEAMGVTVLPGKCDELLTVQEMAGFQMILCKCCDKCAEYLAAPANAPYWTTLG